jgi:hypothetical protein
MFSTKNTVRKSLMELIDGHIQEGEKQFEAGCSRIDEEHFRALAELESKRESDKKSLLRDVVGGILGKIR